MSRLTQAGQVGDYQKELEKETEMRTALSPAIKKMTTVAWDILEYMMSNPGGSQKDCSVYLKVTQAYISRVVNSPCYQVEVKRIRKQRMDEKLAAAGESSVDRLMRITDSDESADGDAIEASKVVLGALGYRNQSGGQGSVSVNVGIDGNAASFGVNADMIAEARARREEKLVGGKGYVESNTLQESD